MDGLSAWRRCSRCTRRGVGVGIERYCDERLEARAGWHLERQRRVVETVEPVGDRLDRRGQHGPVQAFLVAE